MNSAEKFLETHTGDRCSSCRVSYESCTQLMFGSQNRACCATCYSTDTHHERAVPVPLPAAQWLAERRAEMVKADDCAEAYRALPAALSALEKVLGLCGEQVYKVLSDINTYSEWHEARIGLAGEIEALIEKELNA